MKGNGSIRRPAAALVIVLALLFALGVIGDLTVGMTRSAGGAHLARRSVAAVVDVARADAACPDPVAGAGTTTTVRVAAPGAVAGGSTHASSIGASSSSGGVAVTGLGPQAVSQLDVAPHAAGSLIAGAGDAPVVARGTGAAAPGLRADQLTRSTTEALRGLAGTVCATPSADSWFVGGGAVVGQRDRVYLTNPASAPAVVDIELYGPDGRIAAPSGRGIAVAAGRQEVRLLDALSPGTPVFGVHVHARSGQVAAAIRDQQIDGLTPLGSDWLPVAAAPALRQTVAGVTGGPGARRLQVLNPGQRDGIVKVRLVSASGSFAPSGGLDVVEVPAGSVTDVDIAAATAGAPVAVSLDSDVPITAGVLVRAAGTAGQLADLAYAAAGSVLTPAAAGVVLAVQAPSGVVSTLLLTTTSSTAATVRLTPLPPVTGAPQDVQVPGDSQLVVPLARFGAGADVALTVVPLAGSGPVLAVRAVSEAEAKGPFLSIEPVPPGRFTVRVPGVLADLSTGLLPTR